MATQAQIAANRRNAQKSTGPRSPEGKATVAQNAVKHGLLAKQAVVRGEDPEQFEAFRDEMVGELAPVGALEAMLAGRIVGLSWRLRRAERFQNQAFDFMYLAETANPSWGLGRIQSTAEEQGWADDTIMGKVIVRDFADGKTFERLLLYERRIEQSLYRAMAELKQLQQARAADPPEEEVEQAAAEAAAEALAGRTDGPLRQTKPMHVSEPAASPSDDVRDLPEHRGQERLTASRQTAKQSQSPAKVACASSSL